MFLPGLTRPDQYPRLPALTGNRNRRPEIMQLFLLAKLQLFLSAKLRLFLLAELTLFQLFLVAKLKRFLLAKL